MTNMFSSNIIIIYVRRFNMVKITLPENNKTIVASKYQLYLPTEQQLIDEMKKEIDKLSHSKKINHGSSNQRQ